jgi:hypothetical protein
MCRRRARSSVPPAEANSALDEVRPAAERLVALRERMRSSGHRAKLVTAIGGNGGYAASDLNAAQAELTSLAEAALACAERLDEPGVSVNRTTTSVCSTFRPFARRVVELCWHPGEEQSRSGIGSAGTRGEADRLGRIGSHGSATIDSGT